MSSYAPLYVEQLRLAIRYMDAPSIRILTYLCSRADELGRCFPSVATITEECGYQDDHYIYRALASLEAAGYIGYLARSGRDIITGQWKPNTYIINPAFLHISPLKADEAYKLWSLARPDNPYVYPMQYESIRGQNGRDRGENAHTNQQQNQLQEPTTVTNDSNQHPTTTNTLESQMVGDADTPTKSTKRKAKSEEQKADHQPQSGQPARSARGKGKGSANITNYVNPDPINQPLEPVYEKAAMVLNELGFAMPMARGFVKRYGPGICVKVANKVKADGNWKRPTGGFRFLIQQVNVASGDKYLEFDPAGEDRTIADQPNYIGGKYAAFIES